MNEIEELRNDILVNVIGEICGCVDNCGNCKFYDFKNKKCIVDEQLNKIIDKHLNCTI